MAWRRLSMFLYLASYSSDLERRGFLRVYCPYNSCVIGPSNHPRTNHPFTSPWSGGDLNNFHKQLFTNPCSRTLVHQETNVMTSRASQRFIHKSFTDHLSQNVLIPNTICVASRMGDPNGGPQCDRGVTSRSGPHPPTAPCGTASAAARREAV